MFHLYEKQLLYYITGCLLCKAFDLHKYSSLADCPLIKLTGTPDYLSMSTTQVTQLNHSQQTLLETIKCNGSMTVKLLAESLNMTTMGVRQHLASLQKDGLVREGTQRRQGRGRPVKPWQLTQAGHQRFPDSHAEVTIELITSVRDILGEATLDKIIDHRHQQLEVKYLRTLQQHSSVAGKLMALARLRSDEGYMASVEIISSTEFLLKENHCPICAAAEACQGFCRAELTLFCKLFEDIASVERESHILAGATRCSYRINSKEGHGKQSIGNGDIT